MEIVGDNTAYTSLVAKGKVVYVRGEPKRYTLEVQFVDDSGKPVPGLTVQGKSDATRSGHTSDAQMKGVTDSQG